MSLPTILAAAAYYGLSAQSVLGHSRTQRPLKARAAVAYVMRHRDGASYPMIGKRLARADHTTAINSVQRAEDWLTRDMVFAAFVYAQMALPRYSALAAELDSPFPAQYTPPPPKRHPRILPPCPPHLVRLRADLEAGGELVECEGRTFMLDCNGFTREDRFEQKAVVKASHKLLAAMRREHPERFAL